MTQSAQTSKPRRERLMMRVVKGAIIPADTYTETRLRERGYRVGDLLTVELHKPRNPGFWRLAHRIGTLCSKNIEAFHGMDAHAVLKKLQLDGNIECDETRTEVPGLGMLIHRAPRSLSFEAMDQSHFFEVAKAFCRHIAATYWPDLTAEAVQEMADSFIEEA